MAVQCMSYFFPHKLNYERDSVEICNHMSKLLLRPVSDCMSDIAVEQTYQLLSKTIQIATILQSVTHGG